MDVQRVQALACGGLKELPEQFIRPAHERPENSKAMEGVNVPVISLSQPHDVLVKQVALACQEWGFFLVTDHGISPSLIQRLQDVGQEFFRLPQEEKEAYANDAATGKFEGYGTKMTKNSDEKLEWIDYFFHFMSPPSKVNYGVWPQNPPAYRYTYIHISSFHHPCIYIHTYIHVRVCKLRLALETYLHTYSIFSSSMNIHTYIYTCVCVN
jgi:flavonol synthase